MRKLKLRCLRALCTVPLLSLTLLAGCASTYLMDNNVQSFSNIAALPANPTFRFERLPSQMADPSQAQLEALADTALFNAGLRRDDAAPVYGVQVSGRLQRVLSPWTDPWGWGGWGGWGWGGAFAIGGRHGYLMAPFHPPEPQWFHREVSVVVREVASGRVVYETRAVNDGPWLDTGVAFPAMFQAALQGFPNPPAGTRRVDIQLGAARQVQAPIAVPAPVAVPASAPAPAASSAAPR